MDTQLLSRNPQTSPKVEPKITKIDTLSLISKDTKKTSDKLRKIFEKGTYQKKTQLTILNRYKKKLDRLEKQENDRRKKREKTRTKFQAPKVKQFKGSFFDAKASDNPLKALGLLAAFNAVDNAAKGDFSKAIGPALVAGGIFLGPSLLKMGVSKLMKPKGTGTTLQTGTPVSKVPWWERNSRSLSRSNQSYSRFISKEANIGDKARLLRRGLITPRQALSAGGPEALSATTKVGRVSKAFAKFGGSIIPGVGAIVGAADATLRAQAGDVTGSAIAGTAAGLDAFAAASAATGIGLPLAGLASIASFALDLTNLVRDLSGMSANEEAKNKDKLKEQTKEQKKIVDKSKEERQQLTFSKTLNSYERSINKFEEFSKAFKVSAPSSLAKEYREGQEPLGPPPPPGQNIVADTQVVQDAIDFRNSFPLSRGTPNRSTEPYELQLRENTMLYSAGIGNDPTVERVHVEGSSHYSNRAIDIPVNNKQLGDKVAQFWRSRGYYVLWQVSGHYNHVHVQWNPQSSQESPLNPQPSNGIKGYIIVPGHATGGGAPGEKDLVKKLARDSYNKIKRQNPNAQVSYMDLDDRFSDDDSGWAAQKAWYAQMEGLGYEILEIHMDQKNGIGKGVIRSHGKQSSVANKWIDQGNYAYPMNWRSPTNDPNHPDPSKRPLAGPNRGVDLFELGKMKSGTYTQRELDALTSPFVAAVLGSNIPSVQRTSTQQRPASVAPPVVPIPPAVRNIRRNLPYQEQYVDSTPIVVPIPIPRQSTPQAALPSSQGTMVLSGPSEEELLNSFYKRVLLNTLQ